MSVTLTIEIPDDMMKKLTLCAEQEFRTPEGHVLWLIRHALDKPKVRQEDRRRAAAPLFADLRRLHLQRGAPSTRVLAKKIWERTGTSISHTTVHGTLTGVRYPSWEILEKIVRVLDGDVEHYRALWVNAQRLTR